VGGTGEKVAIFDRGHVELSFQADWTFKPDPAGHAVFKDPADQCKVEVSYFRLPLPAKELPPLAEQLKAVLGGIEPDVRFEIHAQDRGDLWLAWAERPYECDDTDRGERRKALSRWLLAANPLFQVLMTFSCWQDDAGWAVAAFERMVATLRLGDGRQLKSPYEHWSLRDAALREKKNKRKPF
jgi:hypothetical protein